MKYQKLFFAAILSLFAAGMTACSDSDENWPLGGPENENCQYVSFPSQTTSYTLDPADPTTLTFKAVREKYDTAITVPVEVTASAENIFTVSPIEFAEGQTETTFTISFPEAEPGTTYTCEVAVTDNAYASIYGQGAKSLSVEVTRVAWIDVDADKSIEYDGQTYTGYEWYTDDIISVLFNTGNPTYPVKVQVRSDTVDEDYPNGPNGLAGIYRMVNPYGALYPLNVPGDYSEEDVYIEINAMNVNEVYIEMQPMGVDWGYGEMYIYSLAADYKASGQSGAGYFGKIEAGAITFPTRSLLFAMADYQNGGFFYTNNSGEFRLVVCQDQEVDYSLGLTAAEPANGTINVAAQLGGDVATVKYATFEGVLDDAQVAEYSEAMEKGTYTTQSITASGTIALSFETTGKYTLVANIYDAAGTLQGYKAISFGYIAANDNVPVVLTSKLELTSQYEAEGITRENAMRMVVYGENIESGYYGFFPTVDVSSGNLAAFVQEMGEKFTDEELAAINGNGLSGMITKLSPGMSYTLVVLANNGYISKVVSTELTTEGTLDPWNIFYTSADLAATGAGYAKEAWMKSWNLYAVDYFETSSLRIPMGQAVISDDTTNDTADDDMINIKLSALDNYLVENTGLMASYADEMVYLLAQGNTGTTSQSLYAVPRFLCQENSQSIFAVDYAMVGGKVADGIIAFVPNPGYTTQGYTFDCYFINLYSTYDAESGAYSGSQGGVLAMGWPLLVEPSAEGTVDAGTLNLLGKALTYVPDNYVELRGLDRARAMLQDRQTMNFAKNRTIVETQMPAGAAVEAKASFTPGTAAPAVDRRHIKDSKAVQTGIRL